MRIVDRATFLAMPGGTIFAKVNRSGAIDFGDVAIKGDSYPNDFLYQSLIPWPEDVSDSGQFFDAFDRMKAGQESASLDYDCEERDGLFDEDQTFLVWDGESASRLVERLQEAVKTGYAGDAF